MRLRAPALEIITALAVNDVQRKLPLLCSMLTVLRHVRLSESLELSGLHVENSLELSSRSGSESDLSDLSPVMSRRDFGAHKEHPVVSLDAMYTLWLSVGDIIRRNPRLVQDFVKHDGFNSLLHSILQLGRLGHHATDAALLMDVLSAVFGVLRQCHCSPHLPSDAFSIDKLVSTCRKSKLMRCNNVPHSLLCELLLEVSVCHPWARAGDRPMDCSSCDGLPRGLIVRPAYVLAVRSSRVSMCHLWCVAGASASRKT